MCYCLAYTNLILYHLLDCHWALCQYSRPVCFGTECWAYESRRTGHGKQIWAFFTLSMCCFIKAHQHWRWNDAGHRSQHIKSPPSRQLSQQSRFVARPVLLGSRSILLDFRVGSSVSGGAISAWISCQIIKWRRKKVRVKTYEIAAGNWITRLEVKSSFSTVSRVVQTRKRGA